MNGTLGKLAMIILPVVFMLLLGVASTLYSGLTAEVGRIGETQRTAVAERQRVTAELDTRLRLLEQGTTRELVLINRRLDGIEAKLDRAIEAGPR